MLRTEQTFELIFGDRSHDTIPDLKEIEVGIFEMKTIDEIRENAEARAWLESGRAHPYSCCS